MSELVEVNTAELVGPALDWAVAEAVGHPADWEQSSGCLWFESSDHEWLVWSPSTNWGQCGDLVDMYRVDITHGDMVTATLWSREYLPYSGQGDTALIAICRAVVDFHFCDVVQVPAELVVAP